MVLSSTTWKGIDPYSEIVWGSQLGHHKLIAFDLDLKDVLDQHLLSIFHNERKLMNLILNKYEAGWYELHRLLCGRNVLNCPLSTGKQNNMYVQLV